MTGRRAPALASALLATCLSQGGCATLLDATDAVPWREDGPHVFGGTALDACVIGAMVAGDGGSVPAWQHLAFLDLPLSVAADVLLFPVTATLAIYRACAEPPDTTE